MIVFAGTEKDCTIYSSLKRLNTGVDEILEISSDFTPRKGPMVSRTLIKFSQDDLLKYKSSLNKFTLNIKVVSSVELYHKCEVEIYPVSNSWEEGKGRFADSENLYPGASWEFRNEAQDHWETDPLAEIEGGGGAWYSTLLNNETDVETPIAITQKLDKVASDIKVDITQFVNYWTSGLLENHGLILKFKNDTTETAGNIKFFSSNTNTIYSPYLEVGVYDYVFDPYVKEANPTISNGGELDSGSLDSGSLDSGSLDSGSINTDPINEGDTKLLPKNLLQVNSDNLIARIKEIKTEYKKNTIERINVGVREKFPTKTFTNRLRYTLENFTTDILHFSVRDAETEEVIIDYSDYTQISCDQNGHYFKFNFKCLSRGRLYKFLIKHDRKETSRVFQDDRTFMVVS